MISRLPEKRASTSGGFTVVCGGLPGVADEKKKW